MTAMGMIESKGGKNALATNKNTHTIYALKVEDKLSLRSSIQN